MFPTEGTTIMQITMHSFIVDEGRVLFIKLPESLIIALVGVLRGRSS